MTGLRAITTLLALSSMLIVSTNLQAAHLEILAGGAMTGIWADLKPQFEQASGHRLRSFWVRRQISSRRQYRTSHSMQVLFLLEVMGRIWQRGPSSRPVQQRILLVSVSVLLSEVVRPKPDIQTPEALKSAITSAQSIASIPKAPPAIRSPEYSNVSASATK